MIYVDDMYAPFRGMRMCHLIADTPDELRDFAVNIGLRLRWIQKRGTYQEHFDVSIGHRELAVSAGAIEVTQRELAEKIVSRKETYGIKVRA